MKLFQSLIVAGVLLSGAVVIAQPADAPADAATAVEALVEAHELPEAAAPADASPPMPDAGAGAEEAAEAPEGAGDQASGLLSAVRGGQWVLAFGFAAMLLGSLLRMLLGFKWDFWASKAGGFVIAGVMGIATLGGGIITAGGFSAELLWAALAATLAAMGAHGVVKPPAAAIRARVRS